MNCQISAESNDAATRDAKKPKLPSLLPYPRLRPLRLIAGLNSDPIHRTADGRSSRVVRRPLKTESPRLALTLMANSSIKMRGKRKIGKRKEVGWSLVTLL